MYNRKYYIINEEENRLMPILKIKRIWKDMDSYNKNLFCIGMFFICIAIFIVIFDPLIAFIKKEKEVLRTLGTYIASAVTLFVLYRGNKNTRKIQDEIRKDSASPIIYLDIEDNIELYFPSCENYRGNIKIQNMSQVNPTFDLNVKVRFDLEVMRTNIRKFGSNNILDNEKYMKAIQEDILESAKFHSTIILKMNNKYIKANQSIDIPIDQILNHNKTYLDSYLKFIYFNIDDYPFLKLDLTIYFNDRISNENVKLYELKIFSPEVSVLNENSEKLSLRFTCKEKYI
jgi:hypothetical protein